MGFAFPPSPHPHPLYRYLCYGTSDPALISLYILHTNIVNIIYLPFIFFPGIKERLGYISDLGVGAVWLSPFFVSPMRDFGYDVQNYTDVDPLFGTLGDFEDLIKEAHKKSKRIMKETPYQFNKSLS